MLTLPKNTRFIISSLLLSTGLLSISLLESQSKFVGVLFLSLLTIVMVVWSIYEAIKFDATLLTVVLPALYTLGVGLFWFLLPSTLLATLPIIILYGVGIFGLMKTMNIFAVSTYKKIALSRAAKGVGFVLTLFTSFLLYDALLSLRESAVFNLIFVFLISFTLLLQGLWSSELNAKLDRRMLLISLVGAYGVAATSLILFFWPVSLIEGSLLLTVGMYVLLGIGQARIEGRLFKATIREYIVVGLIVLLLMIANTSWRYF